MTTAAAPQSSENVWEKHRVGSISKDHKFIRLIDQYDNNDEYKTDDVDISELRTGDIVHAWIENGRLKGVKFPPGMEPITNVPVVKGKSSTPPAPSEAPQQPAQKPADPVQEISGDVSMITEKGIKIGSHEMVFINGVSLGDIKHGHSVKAKIQGNKLLHIQAAPVTPPVLRGGHGLIKELDLNKSFLSYEFSWKDKQTGELKSATQEFSNFAPEVKSKLNQFKVGDKIAVQFSGGGKTAILHEIGPDTKKGGGWGGQPRDPVEEAKRQRMIVRQSSLERSVQLWISVHSEHAGEIGDNQIDSILNIADKFEKWVMRE